MRLYMQKAGHHRNSSVEEIIMGVIMENELKDFICTRKYVLESKPLIHCITSTVAINDCANAVLALGGKPITADYPGEAAQITSVAKALSVSTANINEARMKAIMISGKTALDKKIPCVIDIVGVTCSKVRMDFVQKFLKECKPCVIKGNISEIKAAAGAEFDNTGIDVSDKDAVNGYDEQALEKVSKIVMEFAARQNCVVMASGETDIISDGKAVYFVKNGCESMAMVTGTGCILSVITALYLCAANPLQAAMLAAVTLGICGELAKTDFGMASYHMSLIDELSLFNDEKLIKYMKIL